MEERGGYRREEGRRIESEEDSDGEGVGEERDRIED